MEKQLQSASILKLVKGNVETISVIESNLLSLTLQGCMQFYGQSTIAVSAGLFKDLQGKHKTCSETPEMVKIIHS